LKPYGRAVRAFVEGAAFVFTLALASCSSLNREGPLVTCADLQDGKTNACKEGIIASCKDGSTVTYEVCTSLDFHAPKIP
jgi:hypothetical protein